MLKHALIAASLAVAGCALVGCNTVKGAAEGAEQDIEEVGKNIRGESSEPETGDKQ